MQRIVIVGGGLAGFEAARALRTQGFAGEVVMLAAEGEPPYDRPPLSKGVLAWRDVSLHFDVSAAADVDLRLGTPATGVNAGTVLTEAGSIECDGVVLAVGADPITLPGTTTLRTLTDAHQLRDSLEMGAEVAIIGAGWIGAEVAFAAAENGCSVTVYEAADSPLSAALPADLGLRTVQWYEQLGISLRLGERVDDVSALGADVVLAGLGARPATGFLSDSGIEMRPGDGAIVVDDRLRSSTPGVVAVGDCAAWWSSRYDTRLRIEHWDTALHAPAVAVAALLAGESAVKSVEPYDPVPYFWSDQFGHTIQCAGHRSATDRRVDRSEQGDWAVGWFADSADGPQLTALAVVDRPRDLTQARRLMTARTPIDPEKFADPANPVKACTLG
ncbi:MAG: NAD(P)/FAD-dependent oxidoreductase [Actinomycetia bacterium]|nr:NAD(P)/FAD-dependent oxidoreductase [Actinomycetes bacterium]